MCPVIAIIFLSSAPDSAAEVAKPDLKLCPPYLFGSNPDKETYFLIIKATLLSEISNNFPDLISELSIHFLTAITGVYFARLAGLSTLRSGLSQIVKNEIPIYEIISGAALAFAALLLILPGFATDILGFLLIFPFTRKILFKKYKKNKSKNFIEGEYEDIDKEK